MPVATASTGGLVFYVFIDSVSCIAMVYVLCHINYYDGKFKDIITPHQMDLVVGGVKSLVYISNHSKYLTHHFN